jgi:UDP-glucose 4-epimerase
VTRALVTGGAGFVGRHLVAQLLAEEHTEEVVVADTFATAGLDRAAVDRTDERVRLENVDVLDRVALGRAAAGADVVFNLACIGARRSVHAPLESWRVNAEGALSAALVAAEVGARRMVHVSSSVVYGPAVSLPMSESHPTRPSTVYGAAKLAAELAVRALSADGVSTVVVRPFNLYGAGSHVVGDAAELLPKTAMRVLAGQPPVVNGDGTQTRDFLHVRDAVRAISSLALCDSADACTLNLGSGEETTIAELCKLVTEAAGRPDLVPVHCGAGGTGLDRQCADTTRAHDLIEFAPTISLADGVREVVDWLRAR